MVIKIFLDNTLGTFDIMGGALRFRQGQIVPFGEIIFQKKIINRHLIGFEQRFENSHINLDVFALLVQMAIAVKDQILFYGSFNNFHQNFFFARWHERLFHLASCQIDQPIKKTFHFLGRIVAVNNDIINNDVFIDQMTDFFYHLLRHGVIGQIASTNELFNKWASQIRTFVARRGNTTQNTRRGITTKQVVFAIINGVANFLINKGQSARGVTHDNPRTMARFFFFRFKYILIIKEPIFNSVD